MSRLRQVPRLGGVDKTSAAPGEDPRAGPQTTKIDMVTDVDHCTNNSDSNSGHEQDACLFEATTPAAVLAASGGPDHEQDMGPHASSTTASIVTSHSSNTGPSQSVMSAHDGNIEPMGKPSPVLTPSTDLDVADDDDPNLFENNISEDDEQIFWGDYLDLRPDGVDPKDPHPLDFMLDEELAAALAAGKFEYGRPPATEANAQVSKNITQSAFVLSSDTEVDTDSTSGAPSDPLVVNYAAVSQAVQCATAAAALPLPTKSGHVDPFADSAELLRLAEGALEGVEAAFCSSHRCAICTAEFPTKGQLVTHKKKEHSPKTLHNVVLVSNSCGVTVHRETRQLANGPETAFWCPNCHTPIQLASNLRRHCAKCIASPEGDPESSQDPSMGTRVTLALLKRMLLDDITTSYKIPNATQMSLWYRRLGAAAQLQGQDLNKYAQLVAIPKADGGNSGPTDPAFAVDPKIVEGARKALRDVRQVLGALPVSYLQLLNAADPNKPWTARPLNLRPSSQDDYDRVCIQFILFHIRIFLKCYGSEPDIEAIRGMSPPSVEIGLETVMKAMIGSSMTLKSALVDIIATQSAASYTSLVAYFITSALSDDAKQSTFMLFMASLAIKTPIDGNFKSAKDFTPTLSRFIYISKVCWAHHELLRIDHKLDDEESAQGTNRALNRDHRRAQMFRDSYLRDFDPSVLFSSPFTFVMALRALGMAIASDEDGKGRVVWAADGLSLFLDAKHVKLASMAELMKAALDNCKQAFQPLLNRSGAPMTVDETLPAKLIDNPTHAEASFWFGELPENGKHFDPERYATSIMSQLIHVRSDSSPQQPVLQPDWAAIDDFLDIEKTFLKTLALCIYLVCGMPPRMSELLEATYKNEAGGRLRSIYIGPGGDVVIDLTYHKTEWSSSKTRHNIHIMHPAIASIWVCYMGNIRPVTDALWRLRYGIWRNYLWCDPDPSADRGTAKWDGNVIKRALEYLCTIFLGFPLNINQYRHFADALAHNKFRGTTLRAILERFRQLMTADDSDGALTGYDADAEELDDYGDRIQGSLHQGARRNTSAQDGWSAQSGRTLDSAWRLYAREVNQRAGTNANTLATARLVSLTWASFWGILPHSEASNGQQPDFSQRTDDIETAPQSPTTDMPALFEMITQTVQSAVGAAMSAMRASLPTLPAVDSSLPAMASSSRSRIPLEVRHVRKLLQLNKTNVIDGRPSSESLANTLALVATGGPNIACVAATGAGKSEVWKLPVALIQNIIGKLIVLIVPYKALTFQVLAQCQSLGIAAAEWTTREDLNDLSPQPKVLVISLNKVVSKAFMEWLAEPINLSRVHRVVMDEAHVLLDERTFRACIRRVPQLMMMIKAKQLVFLSATMPPQLEATFQSIVMTPVVWQRDLTHRVNLEYSLRGYHRKDQLQGEINLLLYEALHGPGTDGKEQVMIIAKTRADADEWSRLLGCGVFYSEVVDEHPDRRGSNTMEGHLQAFLRGDTQVIVGTSALGVGIDRPAIRLVCYIDSPYSMVSFAQCSGRASRDGALGKVVVFLRGAAQFHTPNLISPANDLEAINLMLSNEVCLRVPMSAWLDGRPATCFELRARPCSVCRCDLNLDGDESDDDTPAQPGPPPPPSCNAPPGPDSGRDPGPGSGGASGAAAALGSTTVCKRKQTPTASDTNNAKKARTSWPMDTDDEDEVPIVRLPEETSVCAPPPASGTVAPALVQGGPATKRSGVIPMAKRGSRLRPQTPMPYNAPQGKGKQRQDTPSGDELIGWFEDRMDNPFGSDMDTPRQIPEYIIQQAGPSRTRSGALGTILAGSSATLPLSRTATATRKAAQTLVPSRIANINKDAVEQLQDLGNYRKAVLDALAQTARRCPMCTILGNPNGHPPSHCTSVHLGLACQKEFRLSSDNQWGYGQACFYCHLPQDICQRRNDVRTCECAKYKDSVRSILMFLTAYPEHRRDAVEVASLFNPRYELDAPKELLRMGNAWRQVEYFLNVPTYKAFQAVAAVLFVFGRAL
ncbi:hypothetical protein OC844_006822 [Tilletia horrida]|nr:hypothetical protein OC844_006822 [Tilletia horrida]